MPGFVIDGHIYIACTAAYSIHIAQALQIGIAKLVGVGGETSLHTTSYRVIGGVACEKALIRLLFWPLNRLRIFLAL